MPNDLSRRSQSRKIIILRDTLLFSLPVLAVLLLVAFLYYRNIEESQKRIIENNERQNIDLQVRIIENYFDSLLDDISYVSRLEHLLNIPVGEMDEQSIEKIQNTYISFLKRKGIYDQIRFIDKNGMEVVRVNFNSGKPRIVPHHELQNKRDRYYFQKTISIPEGDVYVSPLDLNYENGVVEKPYKPTIRLATPLYSDGQLLGIIVLNYLGETLFHEIQHSSVYSYGTQLLLNPESYWIYGITKNGNWEFSKAMDDNMLSDVFFPVNLEQIRTKRKGFFYDENGLVVFKTIYPIYHKDRMIDGEEYAVSVHSDYPDNENYFWQLVTLVPKEILRSEVTPGKNRVIITSISAAFLIFLGMFVAAVSRANSRVMQKNLREEAAIFHYNPAPVFRINRNYTVVRSNPFADRIFQTDVVGKNLGTLLTNAKAAIGNLSKDRHTIQFEEQVFDKTFLFTTVKEETESSFIVYGMDITNRKEMEQELRKLSFAVEQSANIIMITDINGNITFVNKTFEKVTGYPVDEVIGKNPNILKSGHQPRFAYQDLWRTITSGGVWHGQLLNRKKDGSEYWEEAVITPIKNTEGRIISYLAVKEDITARKQAEEDLQRAKEEAEVANRLKSEFLANMSHEIRTPMNAILGFTELLLDDEHNPQRKERLEVIKKSGRNLLNLINDILDFSKIEAGKIQIERKNFNLRRSLLHIKSMYDIVAEEKGLEFSLNIDDSVPDVVFGDELRMNQIVLNMVSNAMKFTEKGSIKIRCLYNGQVALIHVEDTGIGISKEKLESIFSAFEQGDSSTERRFGGTGLGLAISKRLAHLMNGTILVKSEEGIGSVFSLQLELPKVSTDDTDEYAFKDQIGGEMMVLNWFDTWKDDEDLQNILSDGIRELPEKIKKLEDAVLRKERRDIKFIAHDLKGFSGNLKMKEIYKEAFIIDQEIDQEDYSMKIIQEHLSRLRFLLQLIPEEYVAKAHKTLKTVNIKKINPDYKVLVAEDNVINQRLMKTFLKELNLDCDVADNGRAALEMLRSGAYNLLLLDMQMPVMDGEETIERIRKDKQLSGLYVIALTAHAMKGDAEKYIKLGCDDYLSKPVDRKLLYEKIHRNVLSSTVDRQNTADTDMKNHPVKLQISREDAEHLIFSLKENTSIFNPERIVELAGYLAKRSKGPQLLEIAENLKYAAENFDDNLIKELVEDLEHRLGI